MSYESIARDKDLETEALRQRAIEAARSHYGQESDDLQIDDDATVVEVDEGVWVSAVVFVPNHAVPLYKCEACGRDEFKCSVYPCDNVIADREATDE